MEDSTADLKTNSEGKSGNSLSPKLIGGALVIILVVAILGYSAKSKTDTQPIEPKKIVVVSPTSATMAAVYRNETYSAEGDYTSPGGDEHLMVKVTLQDGIITDAEVTPEATRPNSVKFQEIFAANFKPLVVGKNIDEVKLDKVSGSSLSPKGFNDALDKIKAQAKV